ncbi:TetR family transcriptional regulator [soil metagenome]
MVDRERMLDAAERVIAREGSGASLEAIAAEAGVTKPIVYARVGSRAALSDALAARLGERLIAAARAEVGPRRFDRIALTAFFRTTLETIRADRELFLYVTRGSSDDTSERTLYLAGRSAAPLAGLLAWWREHNGHDPVVAAAWAYAIIGMLNLVSLWWIEEGDASATVMAEQLADLVWSGIDGAP